MNADTDNRRADLEAAYNSLSSASESGGEAASTSTAPPAAAESTASSADVPSSTTTESKGPTRDESGRFASKTEGAKEKPKNGATGPEKPSATPAPQGAAPTATPPPETVSLRAPSSWKLQLREKFGTLPRELQEEIARVDQHTLKAMREAAEKAKAAERWNETYSPYAPVLGAEGHSAVAPLLQLAQTLRTGNAQQKASAIASLVRDHGIPLEPLAQAIDGGPQQGQQYLSEAQIRQQIQAEARQMFQQQQQESQREQAMATIESFGSSKEFFEDVRGEMGIIMGVAHRRGEAMTLEQAYDKACKLHPDVSAVMAQREQAKAAKAAQESAQKARAASSSVRTEPTSGVAAERKSGPNTRMDDLRAAAEALNF